MELAGTTCVITGAASGIGAACARRFAAEGARVAVVDVNAEGAAAVAAEIGGLSVPTDLADPSAIEAMATTVERELGPIDVLFNNAGIFTPSVPLEDLEIDAWREAVDINLTGAFLCTREAFRVMKAQDPMGGRIVNNGSISAHVPRPMSAPYTATKHAITGLTKSTSLDGRQHNIACGQIDIGNAATDMTSKMAEGVPQADGSRKVEPRMDVQNVADAVLYMANLPLNANVQFMTVMASDMPYIGRG